MRDGRRLAILITAIVLAAAPAFARGRHAERVPTAGPWRLNVVRDGFTSEVHCTLQSASAAIAIDHGGIGFHFGKHVDTLTAWYRIDGSTAMRWQDRYPTLIADNVPVDGPSLRNPTGGIVWLPIDDVRNAQAVTIRPNTRSLPRAFSLVGLAAALNSASQQGCALDIARTN